MMKEVMLLMGAGKIEMANARRMGFGKKIIVGDKSKDNVKAVCKIMSHTGTFITQADFLIDGGATASYFYGH